MVLAGARSGWVTMQRPSRPATLASVEVPSADPGRSSPSPAMPAGGAPSGLRQRQAVPELPAGADAELGEHLVQVVLRGPGADEQLGADLSVGVALGGELGDLRLLHGQGLARVCGSLAHGLACRLELPAGPLGERRGPEPAEHAVGGPQVL